MAGKKRKSWYGLKWIDSNAVEGELSEEEFHKRASRTAAEERELFPDENSILEMVVFEKLCGCCDMDFRLQITRTFCSSYSRDLFKAKSARVLPGSSSEKILKKLSKNRREKLLRHTDAELNMPNASLRERMEALIRLVEKDIRSLRK